MTGTPFHWPVRVYYEDTDAGGVVFYANYLKFMERARTEWLRSLGYGQQQLIDEGRYLFAVRRAEVDYRRPARLDDELLVVTRIAVRKRASLTFDQRVERAGELLAQGRVQVACLDPGSFRPCPLPTEMDGQIEKLMSGAS
ncbi:MAG: tol-pal system-associated acyl-CoA thioesterase [Gammaproteobacteria bacterium]